MCAAINSAAQDMVPGELSALKAWTWQCMMQLSLRILRVRHHLPIPPVTQSVCKQLSLLIFHLHAFHARSIKAHASYCSLACMVQLSVWASLGHVPRLLGAHNGSAVHCAVTLVKKVVWHHSCSVMLKAGLALQAVDDMHAARFYHRDLKPSI